jgi:hypothetical protein
MNDAFLLFRNLMAVWEPIAEIVDMGGKQNSVYYAVQLVTSSTPTKVDTMEVSNCFVQHYKRK